MKLIKEIRPINILMLTIAGMINAFGITVFLMPVNLYDSGISAFIHNSNLIEAEACFEEAKKYAEYVATESYLRTRNKMVVFLCDNLKFEDDKTKKHIGFVIGDKYKYCLISV